MYLKWCIFDMYLSNCFDTTPARLLENARSLLENKYFNFVHTARLKLYTMDKRKSLYVLGII